MYCIKSVRVSIFYNDKILIKIHIIIYFDTISLSLETQTQRAAERVYESLNPDRLGVDLHKLISINKPGSLYSGILFPNSVSEK